MTMIEKVARAICHKDGNDWDFNVNKYYKKEYAKLAKAAIEAMREPTDKMVLVAFPDVCFKTAWYAMIDAALKED